MSSLKKRDLASIKTLLLARKAELEQHFKPTFEEKALDEQVQDIGDQAFTAELESLQNSLENNDYEEYQMVVRALEMIDAGTYGICSECGQPISEKRLQL